MDNIYYRLLLNDKVKIEPKFLSKEYRQYLLTRLKDALEGKCSKHGYIKENTIELYKVVPGAVELIALNGNISYEVYFYAEVCNPLIGNVVRAIVTNINKFGILAEVGNVLEIVIPKTSVNIQHDVNPETIYVNQQVIVEVVAKKYELNDKKISIVGKLVSGESGTKPKIVNEDDEEEEDFVFDEEPIPEEEEAAQEDLVSEPDSEHSSKRYFMSEDEEEEQVDDAFEPYSDDEYKSESEEEST